MDGSVRLETTCQAAFAVAELLSAYAFHVFIAAVLGLLLLLLLNQAPRKKRSAALPNEISKALAEAERAAEACLGMCLTTAFVKSLKSRARGSGLVEKPKGFRGPDETELLCKTRKGALRALKRCRSLSVEALQLTADRRYFALRAVFEVAQSACWNCSPDCKRKACPALEYIKSVSLET
jgi:hypothetical protein